MCEFSPSFQMELDESHHPKGIFECQLCKLSVPYTYFGQKPPNMKSVILLEECYIMMDPFTPDKEKFLILGSQCSVCKKVVCVDTVLFQNILPYCHSSCPSTLFKAHLGVAHKPVLGRCKPLYLGGMQPLLLQAILPALCHKKQRRISRGDPTRLG
ncbi:cysteine-rich DPF motif domain-containing protein 1 isoform X1 [Mixophyes fleayi]|uniref:cysteine-rich DPF motif domain-containing protein 1 isoform X1 n=1 Tax=Mixophyes fleayi TaxID=3061075 RepID=UPI003F4DF8D4